MIELLREFWKNEDGLETAEKAVLVVMGVTIAFGAMKQLAVPLKAAFQKLADGLQN